LDWVHRHEKAGVLQGPFFACVNFTQDDAHIFCLPDQIELQISEVIDFIVHIYGIFGFTDYKMELSTRPENFIGSPEIWEKAEGALKKVLDEKKIVYKINVGDGAFYGPKIDFHIKDCLKRSWQCGTVQLDFSMPERFELEYADADGTKKTSGHDTPCLAWVNGKVLSAFFWNIYGGALPLWLSPVQVSIIPISEKYIDYAGGSPTNNA